MSNNFQLYNQISLELNRRANAIKVMLWAGDLFAARAELRSVRHDYDDLIQRSLRLTEGMLKEIRTTRKDIQERFIEDERKITHAEYLLQIEIAQSFGLKTDEDASLFALSPIIRLLRRLDRRISENTDQKGVFEDQSQMNLQLFEDRMFQEDLIGTHDSSGFRYCKIASDERNWVFRAYRLDAPILDRDRFLHYLSAYFQSSPELLPDNGRVEAFSIIRIFTTNVFVSIKAFGSERFQIEITGTNRVDEDDMVMHILDLIAKSQGHS